MSTPQKETVTYTASHLPSGERMSLWILGQLMTFKVHDESETVGIFEIETPPEGGALRICTVARMRPTTSSKANSSSSSASARSMLVPAPWSMFPGQRCTPISTWERRWASSSSSRLLQDRWSSSWKRLVNRLATRLPHKVCRRTWINCR
jgi:hypothetical protein